jgi:GT2 family glycosyltransferase
MLSDDCLLLPGAVNRGLHRFVRLQRKGRRVGAVAFYFRDWPEEKDYYVQRTLGGKLFVNHGLFLREAMAEVDWADEERYVFYKADGDLCLKLWAAGWEVVDCPGAYVEHYKHTESHLRDSNEALLDADRKAYLERWTGIFYHPDRPDPRGRVSVRYDDPDRIAERFLKVRPR